MIKNVALLFFLFILNCGCSENSTKKIHPYQQIFGRDDGNQVNLLYSRPQVYRARVPANFFRKEPDFSESIVDTTKPLCEFIIDEQNKGKIRITVHNFPSENAEERIPSNAQVARWKRQFAELDLVTVTQTPQAYGGFSGLFFEGSGTLANEHITMMAWTMQLAPEHYSALSFHMNLSQVPQEKHFWKQMRGEYTIKAIGPSALMLKHRREIAAFARSFELIQEIPLFS
jgi:hypothetical protein